MKSPSLSLALAAATASLATASQDTKTFQNPLWTGFHPDPTCAFVPEFNNTFFCTTSSFIMFPGLPIYASQDLVNWKHISNAFSRAEQIPSMDNIVRGATSGIYAPTIRYRDGQMIIMSTVAHQGFPGENYTRWDNFIMTSDDPFSSESWSDPIRFDYPGIDPSPYWAPNGSVIVAGAKDGTTMPQAQMDLETGEWLSPLQNTWNGTGLPSPEAPHIYEKDSWLYLVIAEGGTRERHRVNVARSKSIDGPWEPCPHNPILTAYQNEESLFQAVGHADFFQDASGKWWSVVLANRAGGDYAEDPYNSNFPMGRETALTSVTWEDGWPVMQNVSAQMSGDWELPPHVGLLEAGEGHRVGDDDVLEFEPGSSLPIHLFYWRLPKTKHYEISPEDHPNSLALRSSRLNLTGFDGDSTRGWGQTFLARKQTDSLFRFSVDVEWDGLLTKDGHEVGVTILQDQSQHFDISIVMLFDSTSNTTVPHIRFRGLSTTPFRLPSNQLHFDQTTPLRPSWRGQKLRLQVEGLNATHYEFAAGLGGEDEDREMQVFGHTTGDKLIPYYSGAVVGAFATSNGRYKEGDFEAYVSRWRYTGVRQILDNDEKMGNL